MKSYDAAVIGSGLAGLIAAYDLARAGKSVVLVEKASRPGGRAMTVNKNGALFNLGGHALYKRGEAFAFMQEAGIRLEGGSPPTNGSALWRNRLLPLPGDALKLLTSRLLSWSGKLELGGLMMKLGKLDADSIGSISLRKWAEREIHDPMVRHIFYALSRTSTYVQDPDRQLAPSVLLQVQRSLGGGVLYIDGGWQTIVDKLRERAVDAGVTIMSGSGAAQILHDDRVRGIRLAGGETIVAAHVIAAISPADAMRLFPDGTPSSLRLWKEQARPAMAACLDLCLKRLPVPDRHFVIGLDQPVFFTNHSRVAKLSGDGSLVVHTIKYNGPGEQDPKADERMLEQTLDMLQPGWRDVLAERQFLPNITVVHDYPHIGRSDHYPGPAVPEIGGLYVAGDWAGHGELLADAAAASARRASQRILRDLAAYRNQIVVHA